MTSEEEAAAAAARPTTSPSLDTWPLMGTNVRKRELITVGGGYTLRLYRGLMVGANR